MEQYLASQSHHRPGVPAVAQRGNAGSPTRDRAAWETAVHGLRERFTAQELGFGRTALFRIAPRSLIATATDYQFAWTRRKAKLLQHWKTAPELAGFWQQRALFEERAASLRMEAPDPTDEEFCRLLAGLRLWVREESARRSAQTNGRGSLLESPISEKALGLRSSEDYADPLDCPRIAAIYNGLGGLGQFVPFRKGDPEGSRWVDNEPLYIEWTEWVADWMFNNSGRREPNMPVVRNAGLYLTAGVTWSLHANHVSAKSRYQEPCIFDASSSRLTPIIPSLLREHSWRSPIRTCSASFSRSS